MKATSLFIFSMLSLLFINCGVDISGRVVDEKTGEPIPDIKIVMDDGLSETLTDAYGVYKFRNISQGKHKLSFESLDYADDTLAAFTDSYDDFVADLMKLKYIWPRGEELDELIEKALSQRRIYADTSRYVNLPPIRTTRPQGLPRGMIKRLPDENGGEWIIFTDVSYAYITYRYPDGTNELVCPVNFRRRLCEMRLSGNMLLLDEGKDNSSLLYNSFTLDQLRKDSDGDLISDRYEAVFGMDPNSNDTDGDGIDDLNDSFPLVPFSVNPDDTTQIINAYFNNTINRGFYYTFGLVYAQKLMHHLPDKAKNIISRNGRLIPQYYPNDNAPYLPIYLLDVLLLLGSDELNTLYPYLKDLNSNHEHFTEFGLPYLEALKVANSGNIDSVYQVLIDYRRTELVLPVVSDSLIYFSGAEPAAGSYLIQLYDEANPERLPRLGMVGLYFGLEDLMISNEFASFEYMLHGYTYHKYKGEWLLIRSFQFGVY